MLRLFNGLDGKFKWSLRPQQEEILKFIEDRCNKSDRFAVNAPTGTGKSRIAVSFAHEFGPTVIITSSNQLIRQYAKDYPEINILWGKEHYLDENDYYAARDRTQFAPITICNPASYWYNIRLFKTYKAIVVDEADEVLNFLYTFTTTRVAITAEMAQSLKDSWKLDSWFHKKIKQQQTRLEELEHDYKTLKINKTVYARRRSGIRKWLFLAETVKESNHEVGWRVVREKDSKNKLRYYLALTPTRLPKSLINKIFGSRKILLMSATLFPSDAEELLGTSDFEFLDVDSPIPPERRPILLGQVSEMDMSHGYDKQELLGQIKKTVQDLLPLGSGIIHLTYDLNKEAAELWQDEAVYTHTKETKHAVFENFSNTGGVILASGMATGVDLKGDSARWNLIPKLQFPYLGDAWVKKRAALGDGKRWYAFQTLRHVVQAAGRTTRAENDWSVTVVLDKRVFRLINTYLHELPKSFVSALKFSKVADFPRYVQETKEKYALPEIRNVTIREETA